MEHNTEEDIPALDLAGDDQEAGLYAFKLFSAPQTTPHDSISTTPPRPNPAQIISLRTPTPPPSTRAHIDRPLPYYLALSPSPARKAEFEIAAVGGEYVINIMAQRAWPGKWLNWRVTRTTSSHRPGAGHLQEPTGSQLLHLPLIYDKAPTSRSKKPTRARKGKRPRMKHHKRADVTRARDRARREEEERQEREGKERDESLKVKKRLLNRKKQAKKRERERDKITVDGGTGKG